MWPPDLLHRATRLLSACQRDGVLITTAESCTGGMLSALMTEIIGSSGMLDRGFVTYSNAAKQAMLGVPASLIAEHGAVSEACARAMAAGALAHSDAGLAVSITGIAGPDGGAEHKPVGLVHFGCARRGGPVTHVERRFGALGRSAIRLAAVAQALDMLGSALA